MAWRHRPARHGIIIADTVQLLSGVAVGLLWRATRATRACMLGMRDRGRPTLPHLVNALIRHAPPPPAQQAQLNEAMDMPSCVRLCRADFVRQMQCELRGRRLPNKLIVPVAWSSQALLQDSKAH